MDAAEELVEHDTEELVSKRGAGSVVWRFFGFQKSDVDQTTILCKCCQAKILAKGGNTSNLLQHLSRKHVLEYQECIKLKSAADSAPSTSAGNTGKAKEKSSQMSLKDAFAKGTYYDRKSKRWIKITNSITNHIAKDMVPLNTVEKEGFKQMIKTLDPSGANIKKAIELNNWTRLQCFGHRLHLAIERGMKDDRIQRAVGVCKRIVSAFSYSWKKRRDLAIVQNDLGLPKHVLTTEMPTRWGSLLSLFNTSILAEEESDTQLTKDVKRNILAYLNEKYSDQVTDDLLDIASLLDPRFRTKYMDKEKVEQVLSRAVEEIVPLMKAQQDTLSGAAGAAAADAEPVPPPEEKRKKTLASFFKRQSTTSSSTLTLPEEESIRMELTVYLQTTEIDFVKGSRFKNW
ncbi:unnamed protein product [Leuciscus chuanchicus]